MPVVDLAVRESGAGRPLVLLHAFPLHAGLFDQVRHRLPGYRVITPDLRGWGASPLGSSPPGLEAMADDVAACLDRLGLERAVVGGVSMGGYVTMELLRRHPDRLWGALFVDTKDEADSDAARAARLAMAQDVVEGGTPALGGILDGLLEGLLGATTRAHRPQVVAAVRGWLQRADPRAVAWAQQAMAVRPPSRDTLAASPVPLAVVVGEEDTLAPPSVAASMAQARPGTPVEVVPGCGHLAVVEDPDTTAQALLRVLGPLA